MDDYISREAAIEQIACLLRQKFSLSDDVRLYLEGIKDADIRIRSVPAANVRPVVRGVWIRRHDDSCTATCSVCGNENHYAFCIMSLKEQLISQQDMFCPFCGADMRGETGDG